MNEEDNLTTAVDTALIKT